MSDARSDDLPALLLALATENAELRQQLATAQDLVMETAIDAGQLHARIEALQAERDAWKQQAARVAQRQTGLRETWSSAESWKPGDPPRAGFSALDERSTSSCTATRT